MMVCASCRAKVAKSGLTLRRMLRSPGFFARGYRWVDWSKPVARFEEAMATIRALWDSRGELVNRNHHRRSVHAANEVVRCVRPISSAALGGRPEQPKRLRAIAPTAGSKSSAIT